MKKDKKIQYRNKSVIAIHGDNGVGKDTVALMLLYIIADGDNSNFNSFERFYKNKLEYKDTANLIVNYKRKDYIFSYANYLKRILANLYDINIKCFHERKFKDDMYYDIINKKFSKDVEDQSNVITFNQLKFNNIKTYINIAKFKGRNVYIKLRDLMLYFGYVVSNIFGDNIWVDKLNNDLMKYVTKGNIAIISDARFEHELEDITNYNKYLFLIIKKTNDNTNENKINDLINDMIEEGHHIGTYVLENDKSLEDLYNAVYKLYREVVKPQMMNL